MQTYATHRKFVPPFHFVVGPILLTNFFWRVYQAGTAFSWETLLGALLAFALVILGFMTRAFALKVQDRVIRLEMQLRMREILPPAMHARIPEFTAGQMVALRFASDAELADLSAIVLKDNLQDRNTIKKMIKNWKADDFRA
jgi:hypothetical protein